MTLNAGSFCDPLRSFNEIKIKIIVDTKSVESLDLDSNEDNTSIFWLERERVKLISYPYERDFRKLKKATN